MKYPPGSLVIPGWYYRNQPIEAEPKSFGVVVNSPHVGIYEVEKIYMRAGQWKLEILDKHTSAVEVLWDNGLVKWHPVDNLVEVKR